ncbi:MAG: 16S rRNA (cytidine(1402)-2'-O)-methyltransferase [Erysipelotrichales bacterium]
MKRIKYLENDNPTIYVVATPIGNLDEATQRMIDTLNKVAFILCEDTRVSSKLLSHFKIKDKTLESYHLHNEYDKLDYVFQKVMEHKEIALISDAGYPLISDPGHYLIEEATKRDINVVVINGPSAILPALISSGFATKPFTFIGFLSNKSNDALSELEQFKTYNHTLILYEAVHRLNKTLKHILDVFGDIDISISREITKLNEEHIYGRVSELLKADLALKGELVLCLNNSQESDSNVIDDEFILNEINKCLQANMSKKDSIKKVSKQYGIEKNYVYDLVHKI